MSEAPTSDPTVAMHDPARRSRRGLVDRAFVVFCLGAASLSIVILAILVGAILVQAGRRNQEVVQALQGSAPRQLTDWAGVDLAALSDYPRADLTALEALELVDWQALGQQQGLKEAADIARVDWQRVKSEQKVAIKPSQIRALRDMDWDAVLRLLGQPWPAAWWDGYAPDVLLKEAPAPQASRAGIYPAMWGSILACAVCALTAIPLGVGTAILLEEYRPKSRWLARLHGFVQLNITNLAGVPSIVYGILGLTLFANMFMLGQGNEPGWELGTPQNWYYLRVPFGSSVLTGGLTLMLVVLPVVIISAQEALRAVPNSLRQGALALGCTRWQMVRHMTLPAAVPGMMTGTILAMSRAIGEAAPILIIAGIVYITFTPEHLMDDFTVLPMQIYNWAGRPQEDFHRVAAAAIVVLLTVLLSFNAVAVLIRYRFQRPLS
jgi:phosphate transport system permease protein